MALDPYAAEMLTFLAMAFPDVGGAVLDPAEARRILGQVGFPQGPDVAQVEDREIPGPPGAPGVPVRIYRPAADEPLPVIVYFHAGGFVLCDLDSQDGTCRRLAGEVGAVVVSVGYRLAPEHRFPAAVEDAYAALRWASSQAAALGGDPARLAVAGDSSGANLAAVMCLLARELGEPSIAYQLLLYPPTDLLADLPSRRDNADGYFQTDRQLRWYVEQYLEKPDQAEDWRVSPLRAESLARAAACAGPDGRVRPAAGRGRGLRGTAAGVRCRGDAAAGTRAVPRVLRAGRVHPGRPGGRGSGALHRACRAQSLRWYFIPVCDGRKPIFW